MQIKKINRSRTIRLSRDETLKSGDFVVIGKINLPKRLRDLEKEAQTA